MRCPEFFRPPWAVLLAATACLAIASPARAQDIVLAPARDGTLGAWLAAGPFYGSPDSLPPTPPSDSHAVPFALRSGALLRDQRPLHLVTSNSPSFDLKSMFGAGDQALAFFGATLRVSRQAKLLIVLGVDDGIEVFLDGRSLLRREEWRSALHDDDAVPFDLDVGDHALVLRPHQHQGPWQFRARLLDREDLLPPRGVAVVLQGTTPEEAAAAAESMLRASVDLGLEGDRYVPRVEVTVPGGLPLGVDLPVRVETSLTIKGAPPAVVHAVSLGALAAGDRGAFALRAQLPDILAADVGEAEAGAVLSFAITVGRKAFRIDRPLAPEARQVIGRIDTLRAGALARMASSLSDVGVVEATLQLSRERLAQFVASGDSDAAAIAAEARAVGVLADRLEKGVDALREVRGAVRLAYPSALDGNPRPFGMYVPPSIAAQSDRKYPLVIALHGLNGLPMQMIRIFFGQDDPGHLAPWEDRHVGVLPELDAFVIAPSGFGNLSYREAGEVDVMALRDWAVRTWPVDPDRVYITGLSMGGTGTAHVALRHPDAFAAAAPLCGYHSYAFRNDLAGRVLRPWEKSLSEFWSTVSWADNGVHLPLYIVHGKKDLPVKNSGVLIDRYKALGYAVTDEHPDVGHNVWQMTYDGFKAFHWLDRYRRPAEPSRVEFKTSSLRYADTAWVHVDELAAQLGWGRVSARLASPTRLEVTTTGVTSLHLDPPGSRIDRSQAATVAIDGQSLAFAPGQPLVLHRTDTWNAGERPSDGGLRKHRGSSGPVSDAFLDPLMFVYGTLDPAASRLEQEVARTLAAPGNGVEVRWPVVADLDVDAALAATHSLFLVGNARTNAVVRAIDSRLPIHADGSGVIAGERRFDGDRVGTLFIYPNPDHPERYVVVLEGASVGAVLRGMSLPRLVPDFVIYDDAVAGARGQLVLGSATVLAAGSFDNRWALPAAIDDPRR